MFSGLPIVRYTSEERLEEIIKLHEDNGCLVFNPHRYTLEEGGMKRTDRAQLAVQAAGRSQGHPQPRQDDRLGRSQLRFQLRPRLAVRRPQDGDGCLMRVHVVHAHPVETSYNRALFNAAVEALTAAGHEVDRAQPLRRGVSTR